MSFGTCKLCGCTDNDCSQCIEATGHPCYWIDDTHELCSACDISDEMPDEYLDEEDDFQSCGDDCDQPDACSDFGCAIKSGLYVPRRI